MTLLAGGVFLKLPRISRPVRLALAAGALASSLLVESVGGGIRKDPATLSYLILTPGISLWLLAAWDHTESAGRFNALLRWTADVGANPMLGYIAITSLVPGVFRSPNIQTFINNAGWQPWGIAGYALLQTLFVGLVCVIATRKRLFCAPDPKTSHRTAHFVKDRRPARGYTLPSLRSGLRPGRLTDTQNQAPSNQAPLNPDSIPKTEQNRPLDRKRPAL